MDKKMALRCHAKKRAFSRYGARLNRHQLHDIVMLIQSRKGKFISSKSKRVSEWIVRYNGISFRLLYDKMRHEVITFLPPFNK